MLYGEVFDATPLSGPLWPLAICSGADTDSVDGSAASAGPRLINKYLGPDPAGEQLGRHFCIAGRLDRGAVYCRAQRAKYHFVLVVRVEDSSQVVSGDRHCPTPQRFCLDDTERAMGRSVKGALCSWREIHQSRQYH